MFLEVRLSDLLPFHTNSVSFMYIYGVIDDEIYKLRVVILHMFLFLFLW